MQNNVAKKTQKNVRLNLLVWHISAGIVFFSHNKSASAGLSAVKTISRIALGCVCQFVTAAAIRCQFVAFPI
jgi:hypothetical protein